MPATLPAVLPGRDVIHQTADPRLLVELLRVQGYCVLPGVLPAELIGDMREAVAPLVARAQVPTDGFRDHRARCFLASLEPFQRPEVWARPEVLAPLRALLGPGACLSKLILDVNLPGSTHQPSHMDTPYLFPEAALSLPPFSIVLTFPLVDVDEEMGPMEMWPCTQGNTRDVDQDALIPFMRSVRFCLKAGSLLLRDARTWHRGTPNRSQRPRPQVSLSYHRRWYGGPHATFPAAVYDRLPEEQRAWLERGA